MSIDAWELRRMAAGLVPERLRKGAYAAPPFWGHLDRPFWRGDALVVRGWLASPGTPIERVQVRAAGRVLDARAGVARPDVAAALGMPSLTTSGFELDAMLPRDVHALEVWAALRGGAQVRVFTARVDAERRPAPPAKVEPVPAMVQPIVEMVEPISKMVEPLRATSGLPVAVLDALGARTAPIVVELDPPARTSALAEAAGEDARVYLVGRGLGAPGRDPRVCVIDAAPEDARALFTDGSVDVLVAHAGVPAGWATALAGDGVAIDLVRGDGRPLAFAVEDAPQVSIVIPVHGRLGLTLRCLASLAAAPARRPFELIVVDDASPDRSAAVLARVAGVRVVSLPENVGFVHACNRGAAEARGRTLVFLNNDTEVEPGWLDALCDTFDDHPEAGLVGAKLILSDGTLQEAGSLFFRDGSAMNWGRGDRPDRPEYEHVRDVDYCSGACIAIPRALFERLGGFDPLYAPAYYEDGDLAWRVREAGFRVLYQPRCRVHHAEGGTAGTDVRVGPKRYQLLNQEKFRRRWQAHLATYPERPADERAADPDRHGGPRVLVIDHITPRPDLDSGSLRMDGLLRLLAGRGLQLTFAADSLEHAGAYTERLQRRGVEVLYAPHVGSIEEHLRAHGRRYRLVVLSKRDPAAHHLAAVRAHAPQAFVAFDTVDLHFVREGREAALSGDAAAIARAAHRRDEELALARAADLTIVVSPVERSLLAEHGIGRALVLGNLHEVAAKPAVLDERRRELLFVGFFLHTPNADAARYFLREVWPLVEARLPEARVTLIGRDPPPDVCALAGPRVSVAGQVAELAPHYEGARALIAPLRYGAGVKGKLTHALSRGLPVVATSIAAEGMGLRDGEEALLADTPRDFAAAIERLYREPALWAHLAERGLAHARAHFSTEIAARAVDALLEAAGLAGRAREAAQ